MRSLLGSVLVLVVLAGCGTSDDREQARAVVERFAAAVADGRGGDACAQLSRAAAEQLAGQAGSPCERAVTDLDVASGPVVAAEVFITNAKVDQRGGQSAFLTREREGWRLSAVGCRVEAGKPRDGPLSCEVEA